MLIELQYFTLINYSPRGNSILSQNSRKVCDGIKGGNTKLIQNAFNHFTPEVIELVRPYLNNQAILIPVPRSSLLVEGALWPSHLISTEFLNAGYGQAISTCIQRVSSVPKSSRSYTAETRPTVQTHYDSLRIVPEILPPGNITLVDDVLTMGRTTFACAQRIHEVYPEREIKVFSFVRTQGLRPEISSLVDPSIGTIGYNANTGRTTRND